MTHIFPYKNRNRHDFLALATVLERKSIREFTWSSFSSLGNKMGGRVSKSHFHFVKNFYFLVFFGLKYCISVEIYIIFWPGRRFWIEGASVNLAKVNSVFKKIKWGVGFRNHIFISLKNSLFFTFFGLKYCIFA